MTNAKTVETDLFNAGRAFAAGKAAPLDAGRVVFANAPLFAGKEGAARAWNLYADGQNAAVPGSIDTSDAKSAAMKTGRSKFNVFLRLAGSQVPQKGTLIDRTVACFAFLDTPPASPYEAALKVIRAQLKAENAGHALSDEEIVDILTPVAQGELDKIAAILTAMETYAKMYPASAHGKFASAFGDMTSFKAERLDAHKAADAVAADLDA